MAIFDQSWKKKERKKKKKIEKYFKSSCLRELKNICVKIKNFQCKGAFSAANIVIMFVISSNYTELIPSTVTNMKIMRHILGNMRPCVLTENGSSLKTTSKYVHINDKIHEYIRACLHEPFAAVIKYF